MPAITQPSRTFGTRGIPVVGGAVLTLVVSRFFYVAESATQGDTLWIVALWILTLGAWLVIPTDVPRSVGCRSLIDVSAGLLVLGHLISAMVVVWTAGDKRAAVNLAWEWMGIGTGWYLLRQLCAVDSARRELIAGLIASATVIAGQGLYQHYIDFPQLAAKYGPLIERLKTAGPADAAQIRQQLAKDNVPLEGPAVTLFEKRLRDSREPLGMFALANTLGGLLAVGLVLAIPTSMQAWRSRAKGSIGPIAAWAGMILLLIWCLMLTKSRTAWIGTTVGLFAWWMGQGRQSGRRGGQLVFAGLPVVLAVAVWGLVQFGGLDQQVITEAPKSLQYRLQYWAATSQMIRDHFLFGVGPGQFRSSYVFYKLPEASEEISDPHNLVLDVAANGGLIAIAGLMALMVLILLRFGLDRGTTLSVDQSSDSRSPAHGDKRPDSVVAIVVSCLVAGAWMGLLLTGFDDRLLILLPAFVGVYWIVRGLLHRFPTDNRATQVAACASVVTLLVHLTGAGGIEMPAITLLLCSLAVLTVGDRYETVHARQNWSIPRVSGAIVLSGGLFLAVFLTALGPTLRAQEHLAAGDRLIQKGAFGGADSAYALAAMADPISGEPWRRRAELAYLRAEHDQFRSNESFQNAVRLLGEAVRRDPSNFHDDRRLGDWWQQRWQQSRRQSDAQAAADAYEHGWKRYPTNPILISQLALALDAAEEPERAREVAKRALMQDGINRERGHVDRYLADPVTDRLRVLAEQGTEN